MLSLYAWFEYFIQHGCRLEILAILIPFDWTKAYIYIYPGNHYKPLLDFLSQPVNDILYTVSIYLKYLLGEEALWSIGNTLWRVSTMFTHSAITPPEVNGFG